MNCKIKVFLLGIIGLIFSIFGYISSDKAINSFDSTEQSFRRVTYELSPLFDAHALLIADSQVKAAHGLISFEQFCKNINLAKESIQKHIKQYEEKVDSEEDALMLQKLKNRCQLTFDFIEKIEKICKEQSKDELNKLIENGELHKTIDPALELINEILEKELILSSIYSSDSIKSLKQFEKFICAFMALSIVMSIASFLPLKHSKKLRKRVK